MFYKLPTTGAYVLHSFASSNSPTLHVIEEFITKFKNKKATADNWTDRLDGRHTDIRADI